MLRFLFCVFILFSFVLHADDQFSFSEKHIYPVLRRGTDQHSGVTFLTGALVTTLSRSEDDSIRDKWKENQKISEKDSEIGDLIGTGAASLLALGGQYFFDPDESRYQSHLRGFVYGGISIYTLKTAFGRKRPGGSKNYQSFPSGHTAISFMSATQIATAYGWPAGIAAFAVAGFTGASRIADDAHWFSDTVGGAFLGYYVGRATFYDFSQIDNSNNKITLKFFPLFESDRFALTGLVSF